MHCFMKFTQKRQQVVAGCYIQLENNHVTEPSAVAPDARGYFTDNPGNAWFH
jgi:hypothetical protein